MKPSPAFTSNKTFKAVQYLLSAKEERKRLAWPFSTTSTEMVCLCPCFVLLSVPFVFVLVLAFRFCPCPRLEFFCLCINLSLPLSVLAVLNIRILFYSCTLQVSSGMTWRVTMRSQSFAKMSQVKFLSCLNQI